VPGVLIVAYHFPPLRGSSGIQRTLRFCQYLPKFGWQPMVLTVDPRAYESVSEDLAADVDPGTPVVRAFALDAARHLALRGAYPAFLATPDRWSSWLVAGVIAGLRLVRRHKPRVIFSTYPIATAHLIGLWLHRLTGLPWVADFRDPMAQDEYPADARLRARLHRLDAKVVRHATRALFTTPGAIAECRARYPDLPAERWALIENGYDEEAFAGLAPVAAPAQRFVLLHSGIVYTSERDPSAFIAALGALKRTGAISAASLEVRFRASANDALLRALSQQHDVADVVSLEPPLPYRAALGEMMSVDALLLLQAANCNSQIPAKVYEYLRAGRPVFSLTDERGDTAGLLNRAGLGVQAPLDAQARIAEALQRFVADVRARRASVADPAYVRSCSRFERSRELASVLDAAMAS